jgi:hypothetical protein
VILKARRFLGTKVTLLDTNTGRTQVSTSDANGIYQFNALPAPYRLTAEAQGFKQKVLENVVIIPEQPNGLDLQLEVGAAQETVTVSGTTQALDLAARYPGVGGGLDGVADIANYITASTSHFSKASTTGGLMRISVIPIASACDLLGATDHDVPKRPRPTIQLLPPRPDQSSVLRNLESHFLAGQRG